MAEFEFYILTVHSSNGSAYSVMASNMEEMLEMVDGNKGYSEKVRSFVRGIADMTGLVRDNELFELVNRLGKDRLGNQEFASINRW